MLPPARADLEERGCRGTLGGEDVATLVQPASAPLLPGQRNEQGRETTTLGYASPIAIAFAIPCR